MHVIRAVDVGAASDTCEPYMERLMVTHSRVAQVRNKHCIPQAAWTVSERRCGTQPGVDTFARRAHRPWTQASTRRMAGRDDAWEGESDWARSWGAEAPSHRHWPCDLAGEIPRVAWLWGGEG